MELQDDCDKLQCGACLQSLCNPKMLTCDHIFCKCCLDQLLEFDIYGNALIVCPEGCFTRTFVSNSQTTNDLSVNCRVGCSEEVVAFCLRCDSFCCDDCCRDMHRECRESLVEIRDSQLDIQDTQLEIRDSIRNCESDLRFDCKESCSDSCMGDTFERMKMRRTVYEDVYGGGERRKLMCRVHVTEATHLCVDGAFICRYCAYRKHRGHVCEALCGNGKCNDY